MLIETHITTTREKMLEEVSDEDLFELFKKKVTDQHGSGFEFCQNKNGFSAKKNGLDATHTASLHQNLVDFLKNSFDSSHSKTGLGVRTFNCLMAAYRSSNLTVGDLLNKSKEDIFKFRLFGEKSYNFLRNELKRLGFKPDEYPLFKK
jgi:DNA-directed RNA polymerase alpha subunit